MPIRIINLTPHAIYVEQDSDSQAAGQTDLICIPPSGQVARCAEEVWDDRVDVVSENGCFETYTVGMGAVEGLPAPQEDVYYITSTTVQIEAGREDVLSPGTANRDAQGRITSVKFLKRIPGYMIKKY